MVPDAGGKCQTTQSAPLVRFDHVGQTYHAGLVAVSAISDLSLTVQPIRFTVIVGRSGSGKTTLLNLIGCIDTPTEGCMDVCGEDVARLSDNALADFRAHNIGFIFPGCSLVPVLSAYENVEYPLPLTRIDAAERHKPTLPMLAAVGLAERARQRPRQLARSSAWLSHAHWCRSERSCSLINPPPIWIPRRVERSSR